MSSQERSKTEMKSAPLSAADQFYMTYGKAFSRSTHEEVVSTNPVGTIADLSNIRNTKAAQRTTEP